MVGGWGRGGKATQRVEILAPNADDDKPGLWYFPRIPPLSIPIPIFTFPSDLQRTGKSLSSLGTASTNTAQCNNLKANLLGIGASRGRLWVHPPGS